MSDVVDVEFKTSKILDDPPLVILHRNTQNKFVPKLTTKELVSLRGSYRKQEITQQ
jgi:hypothetical protein